MPATATVRPATTADLPDLRRLDEWPRESAWTRLIGNEEVLVVEVDGAVVGLLHYTILWATVPFLSLIVLQEDARGRGLSRVLVDDLVARLKGQGYVALLSSSQTDEPEPQAWHRHLGFTSNGIIENIADEGIGEVVFRLSFGEG
ncbi:GNAT family N-acetyltransferase [Serinicoccus kebangsaanensis]|uniref:GNAT family N-acetyltransferase n=1 Tax=Serinicoccus kebangsaanensis TaxID=2602069 RepID=UPI00178C4D2D|nr:GNAT family N-acetyltransferase [Serinicoccus kebangsaanensis]